MSFMFMNAYAFNNGGTANIDNWDTSSVTNMFSMFISDLVFNQDIGSWDTSKVTDVGGMFYQTITVL
ncbi:MAG: BspA family leucine-rich repeat surface protein [Flavobacteriales bacterium]|jgi:hypothetical protein|tara:strand:- start:71 stop:271 length:201 start_codon:yes stop_codon:yes gene_type:complete